mmetsp:Transcript_24313/g.57595  ORF Transcript_24313/g.57595 Transcript_24313/m.57595 type:complete len:143 (+) Transcript_24313:301-729(+)
MWRLSHTPQYSSTFKGVGEIACDDGRFTLDSSTICSGKCAAGQADPRCCCGTIPCIRVKRSQKYIIPTKKELLVPYHDHHHIGTGVHMCLLWLFACCKCWKTGLCTTPPVVGAAAVPGMAPPPATVDKRGLTALAASVLLLF